jgi:hypothetical protein
MRTQGMDRRLILKGKGKKLKFPRAYLIKYRHEDVYGSRYIAPQFIISALDGGEWSASRLSLYTPGQIAPGTH